RWRCAMSEGNERSSRISSRSSMSKLRGRSRFARLTPRSRQRLSRRKNMESADCSLADVIGSGHLRVLGVRGKRHQLWPQNSYPRWVNKRRFPAEHIGFRNTSTSCPGLEAGRLSAALCQIRKCSRPAVAKKGRTGLNVVCPREDGAVLPAPPRKG